MNATSIKCYYGFALKSGGVVFGADKVCESKKLYLVFANDELADNTKKKLVRKTEKCKIPILFLTNEEFRQIEANPCVKCVGIKNAELAKAMQKD